MKLVETIAERLRAGLPLEHLDVQDESHLHARGTETHFRVLAVADAFAGMSRVARHQKVFALLGDAMHGSLHALSLQLFTPEEFAARQGRGEPSPACRGGSLADPLFRPHRTDTLQDRK